MTLLHRTGRLSLTMSVLIGLYACVLPSNAHATILQFNVGGAAGDMPNATSLPSTTYGDNVAGAMSGGYSYGNGGEGYTPNVTMSYLGTNLDTQDGTPFSPLNDVVYPTTSGTGTVTYQFQADAGYSVQLLDFEVANWEGSTITFESIEVLDSASNILASATNVGVPTGNNILNLAGVFGASTFDDDQLSLVFRETSSSPGMFWIAFDNIRFSQSELTTSAVPEPSTLGLAIVALAALGIWQSVKRRIR